MWTFVLALLPTILVFLWTEKFDAFRVLVISTVSGLLSEFGMQRLLKKRGSLYDGSALLTSLLFALLIPLHLTSWQIALGAAFGMIFGKQIFGGLGQNPFHPAVVGCAFVFVAFAQPFHFETPLLDAKAYSLIAATALGGCGLVFSKIIRWETPLLYFTGFVLFSLALGEQREIFYGPLLVAAFFLATDLVTTPLTRMGQQWFALGAGILSALFSKPFPSSQGVIYAILWMNAFNPWFDQLFRPTGARKIYGLNLAPE